MIRTALNANVSWWRRRRREVTVPDPGLVANSPAEVTADSLVDPAIMAAVLRLPARQRQVVALRLFLDLDTGRTADRARHRAQHGQGSPGPGSRLVAQ